MKKKLLYLSSLIFSFGFAHSALAVTMLDYDNESVSEIIEKIINWVLIFAGSLAILFIVWGGVQYVISSGNKDRIESAKKTLTYAIIGLIVVILARFIVGFIDFNVQEIVEGSLNSIQILNKIT